MDGLDEDGPGSWALVLPCERSVGRVWRICDYKAKEPVPSAMQLVGAGPGPGENADFLGAS